jgi:hypothetical protein
MKDVPSHEFNLGETKFKMHNINKKIKKRKIATKPKISVSGAVFTRRTHNINNYIQNLRIQLRKLSILCVQLLRLISQVL